MLDQRVDDASSSVPDPVRQVRPGAPKSSVSAVGAQSTIGKTLLIKGEITGSGSVHIEGKVEGTIALPDDRVTVDAMAGSRQISQPRISSCSARYLAAVTQAIIWTFAVMAPCMEMSWCRASPLRKELT